MTDHDDDVSRRYRELPRDEPPAALDAAIVASARQAVAPRRSHWTRALSIAAVLVLAVGITLRMQHEEPGIETAVPEPTRPEAPAAPVPAQPAPSSQPSTAETAAPISKRTESRAAQRAQKAAPPASQRAEPRKEAAPASQSAEPRKEVAPASQSAEPRKEVAPAPRQDPAAEMALPETTTGAAATSAPSLDSAKNAAPTPQAPPTQQAPPAAGAPPASAPLPARVMAPAEKRAKDLESAPAVDARLEELERIAKLREAGNDAEADAALAEFRRRNPGYRMPDAMWARVKPR